MTSVAGSLEGLLASMVDTRDLILMLTSKAPCPMPEYFDVLPGLGGDP